jgi:hypothetical protein
MEDARMDVKFFLGAATLALAGCGQVSANGSVQALTAPSEVAAASPKAVEEAKPIAPTKDAQGRLVVTVPTVTAEQAEAVARQEVGGTYESIDVTLRTYQWVADNVGYSQDAYSPDSLCWLVTIKGQLNMHPKSPYWYYVQAQLPVSADRGIPGGLQMCGGNCDAPPLGRGPVIPPPAPVPRPPESPGAGMAADR